jgi:UDP-N-acetylmuramyl pentapeptide phosphotransferase/UDP-N-acetylglucosamine-1-phosphate transferase
LGYNVAIFTIYYANQSSSNFWIWVILFSLFWFDATLTLFRRYKKGEKLSQAHKKHAYQRLTQSGWSHSKVVIFSLMLNIILFAIVYFISNIFIACMITLILLYSIVRRIDKKILS